MSQFKLPPLFDHMFNKIGLIYDAYKLCSSYSINPYIPEYLKKEPIKLIPLYREMMIQEIEIVKNILLEEMIQKEDLWQE